MTTPKVTVEKTPGGFFFVRIEPPQAKYPMRSFKELGEAKIYKYLVEMYTGEQESGEDDDQEHAAFFGHEPEGDEL